LADDETDEEFQAEDIGTDFEDAPEELEEDLVDDEAGDGDFEVIEEDAVVEEPPPAPKPKAKAKAKATAKRGSDDDDDEEDDEEADPDDVEADLDTILKDRIAAQPDEDEGDEDETPEPDERGDGTGRIQPKRPGEFVCQSCFLVKHPSQLADDKRMLCRDCV
jgi:Domain of unknown function (DUF4193)